MSRDPEARSLHRRLSSTVLDGKAAEAAELAARYASGEKAALPALYDVVGPAVEALLKRYRGSVYVLPPSLDLEDLRQQCWVLLADLAQRWRPGRGLDFGPFLCRWLPWLLDRYVKNFSATRRSRLARVVGESEPLLQTAAAEDGRPESEGLDHLEWEEMVSRLPPGQREAVILRLHEDRDFGAVAMALGVSRPAAYRLYHLGIRRLRKAMALGSRVESREPSLNSGL